MIFDGKHVVSGRPSNTKLMIYVCLLIIIPLFSFATTSKMFGSQRMTIWYNMMTCPSQKEHEGTAICMQASLAICSICWAETCVLLPCVFIHSSGVWGFVVPASKRTSRLRLRLVQICHDLSSRRAASANWQLGWELFGWAKSDSTVRSKWGSFLIFFPTHSSFSGTWRVRLLGCYGSHFSMHACRFMSAFPKIFALEFNMNLPWIHKCTKHHKTR